MNREIQAFGGQDFRGSHRRLPRARQATKGIVSRRINRIETDARPLNPTGPHAFGLGFAQQHPIGTQHHSKANVAGLTGEVEDILAHERLATGENQQCFGIDLRDVPHDAPALRGGEFP